MPYENPDQRRADQFCERLAKGPGASSEVILDELLKKPPQRESEKAQGGDRLVDDTRTIVGPQRGSQV
jgi:hypothetical protein